MKQKKECVAMLLAGGQGSRLYALTRKTAKPAVRFGGKYRVVDFPLSNCINSGIDTVGVLTQYQPLVLNEYIGNGFPWDLDRNVGGVKILPPYQGHDGADWYRGTANAIYQNLEFLSQYDPDYVLILSGDHIYHMDYGKMLAFHKEKEADCTVAVLEVPLSEASRFGILTAREDGTITKFTEKPAHPDSTKASMGIYIFSRQKLFDYLAADNADPDSANDFGKNIIPRMLAAGEKLVAYPFSGYWRDVGTVQSLYDANMDLLGETPALTVSPEKHRVYARHRGEEPQYIGKEAAVENSAVTEGCEIEGTVRGSVLGSRVKILAGARVVDSVLFGDTVVGEGATVTRAILDEGVNIGAGARIGGEDETAPVTVLGAGMDIPAGAVIPQGKILSE